MRDGFGRRSSSNVLIGSKDKILRSEELRQQWTASNTPEELIVNVYEYWKGKGFYGILLTQVLSLCAYAFMIVTMFILALCVDYTKLFSTYVVADSLVFPIVETSEEKGFILFLSVFVLFWVYHLLSLFVVLTRHWKTKQFFETRLRVACQDVTWEHVVRLLMIQLPLEFTSGDHTFQIDELYIVNTIMLQDNYLCALINENVLRLEVPILGVPVLTKALEWGIRVVLMDFLFQRKKLRDDVVNASNPAELAASLRRRFFVFGCLGLLLSPFIFVGVVVYFVFKYGEQIKNKPGDILSLRNWSPVARWKFRDWNELPHVFQRRIHKSYKPAYAYVDQFVSGWVVNLARFVAFIGSALFVILLGFGLYDDNFFSGHIVAGEMNVLVVMAFLCAVVAVARQIIPPPDNVFEPARKLMEVSTHTHYFPESWTGDEGSSVTFNTFLELFPYSALLWFYEGIGIILAPIQMCTSLAGSSEQVINFIIQHSVILQTSQTKHSDNPRETSPTVNQMYVCRHAVFDIKNLNTISIASGFVPPSKGGRREVMNAEESSPLPPPSASTTSDTEVRMSGKLEQSILNFKMTYPEWQPRSQEVEIFLDNCRSRMPSNMENSMMLGASGLGASMMMRGGGLNGAGNGGGNGGGARDGGSISMEDSVITMDLMDLGASVRDNQGLSMPDEQKEAMTQSFLLWRHNFLIDNEDFRLCNSKI